MSQPFTHSYPDQDGEWIRGNIHGHTSEHSPCSSVPLLRGVSLYSAAGAGFMAVTDHDHVTDLAEARRLAPGMVFLEGFEYSRSENILFVGEEVPALHELSVEDALTASDGLLTVICHPRWKPGAVYWSIPMIMGLPRLPAGIEIYNGHYARPHVLVRDPNPLYTDVWDELLGRGVRIWGFASDDFHDPPDFGRAFIMAWVTARTPAAVLEALKAGRFYATTGLLLQSVGVEGPHIRVRLGSASRGRFVGPGGSILRESHGERHEYTYGGEPYVRFEAEGEAGRIFLQPVFREPR